MVFPITISDTGLPVVISENGYGLPVVILGGGSLAPRVALSVTPSTGITDAAPIGTIVATITTDATTLDLGGADAGLLNISGANVVTTATIKGRSGLTFTVLGTRADYSGRSVSLTVPVEVQQEPTSPTLTAAGGGYDASGFGTFPETTATPADGGYNLETV